MRVKTGVLSILICCFYFGSFNVHAQTGMNDFLTTGRFRIIFKGIGEFRAVRIVGLESESIFDEENPAAWLQPSRHLRPAHLIIVRHAIKPDDLWRWRQGILAGKKDVRKGRIDLMNSNRESVLTWEIDDAWPFKWVWPECDAIHPDAAMEEIHFIVQEIRPAGNQVIPLPVIPQTLEIIQK